MAFAIAAAPVRSEKWSLYLLYISKRIVDLSIGGILLGIRLEWLLAAVMTDSEVAYYPSRTDVTETQQVSGFGVEVTVQMS